MEPESSQPPDSPTPAARARPRHDPFLITCRFFSVITSLAAILCIAVNVLSAVQSFKNGSDIFDGIFRCYAVVIAVFVVIAETEWEFIMKFSKVLEYWAGRGMLQIFVAVLTRAYPEYLKDRDQLYLLQSIASYLLLACGVVYIISGLFCIGMVKRSRQKKKSPGSKQQRILRSLSGVEKNLSRCWSLVKLDSELRLGRGNLILVNRNMLSVTLLFEV